MHRIIDAVERSQAEVALTKCQANAVAAVCVVDIDEAGFLPAISICVGKAKDPGVLA